VTKAVLSPRGSGLTRLPFGSSLKTYVVGLVLLVIVAAGGSASYERTQASRDARQTATRDAQFAARLAAHGIGDTINLLRTTVASTASNSGIAAVFAAPAGCNLSFGGPGGFTGGHLDVVGPDGSVICSSSSGARPGAYAGAGWLAGALKGPLLIGPISDARTGRQVLLASAPVPGHGAVIGVLDLEAAGPALASSYGGPRPLEFLVTSADGKTVVARSIDPARWVGKALVGTSFVGALTTLSQAERRDVDGTPRLYGTSKVAGTAWLVYAGASRADALAAANDLNRRELGITLIGLLVILAAAFVMYRRIARPIRQLSLEVRAATGHIPTAPISMSGPTEVLSLVGDFRKLVVAAESELVTASRLAAIVESSADAIIGKTLDGVITTWNAGAKGMYGYTADEAVGCNISMVVPSDRCDELPDLLERLGRGERVEPLETERIRKDGVVLDVSITVSPVRDATGRIVGASSVARDITHAKLAVRALRASEARKTAVVESAPDCIITMDHEGRIIEFNPAAEHTFGYSKAAVVGREMAEVIIPPSRRDAHRAGLARYLATGEGSIIGRRFEITAMRADGTEFPVELAISKVDLPGPPIFIGFLRDVTEPQRAERELLHQAMHDGLTGLPNRLLLVDRLQVALERAGRQATQVAVVFVDIDRFKDVNTAHGHAGGDALLSEVARRLASGIRGSDTVARFGGDEFVVVSEGSEPFADSLADRLRASMTAPCTVGGTEVPITVSMGVVVGRGGDYPDALLRDADVALFQAKAKGRNRTEFFSDALRLASQERLALMAELHRAVDQHEFSLRFQPVVRLDDASIVGAEALLRWEHPERGTVEPDEFISVAEETGLIIPIGRWVIEESCRRLAEWQRFVPKLTMAVNVSARQLTAPGLDEIVQAAFRENGLEPSCLLLEVTEGVVMDDVDFFRGILADLRTTGARTAIDDFGTGYSSLAYLERFPVDVLKIDQCFVAGLPDDTYDLAIVRAVIAISQALNLSLVAEGVEHQAQAEALLGLGCQDAQGYHFYRPLTGEDFEAALVLAHAMTLSH
jgi:diguanylate cyclase (GGDEF)-like protein/PAS domain S-box-containing protein